MPPDASSMRRSARFSARDPEPRTSQDKPGFFVRPQLPALTGTPSSRRQYTYGSGVEPPPRPGSGLQRMDLSSAVNQALTKNQETGVFVRPQSVLRKTATRDVDEDELANPSTRLSRPVLNLTKHSMASDRSISRASVAIDDGDSMRSFAMESDYYGDATIESTPRSTPVPETRPAPPQLQRQRQESPTEALRQASPEKQAPARFTAIAPTRPRPADAGQRLGRAQPEPKPQPARRDLSEDGEESEEEDEEDTLAAAQGHRIQTNTPAPNRMRQSNVRELRSRKEPTPQESEESEESEDEDDVEEDRARARPKLSLAQSLRGPNLAPPTSLRNLAPPTKQRQTDSRTVMTQSRTTEIRPPEVRPTEARPAGVDPSDVGPSEGAESRKTLHINERRGPGLFAQADELNRNKSSFGARTYPDDPLERDAAIQREIMEAEDQIAREREEQAAAAELETRRQRWGWFLSLWPITLLRRLFGATNHDEEDSEQTDDGSSTSTEWTRFFNPMTYIQAVVWLVDKAMDHLLALIDKVSGFNIRQWIPTPGDNFLFVVGSLVAGLLGIAAMVFLGPVIAGSLRDSSLSMPNIGLPSGINWPAFGDITDKIGNLVPSISWPSSRSLDDISDLWDTNDDGEKKANNILKRYEKDLSTLAKAGRLHAASIQKLETVVPKVVRMELRDGKPVVTQEFWYALRDLIQQDGQMMTVEKKEGEYQFTSEAQWQAIIRRLNKDPTFASKLNLSAAGIEERLDSKMTGTWEAWVKNNNDKISELLGTALEKIKSAGSGKEFDRRLAQIVKEQIDDHEKQQPKEVVVTRDEFLRHLQNEFATHRSELRGELDELEVQIEHLRKAVRMATENIPEGVSKAEVGALVDRLVRKTIADMNLGSIANGKIRFHWDAELKNQVNYFSVGSGATIDAKRTSATYDMNKAGIVAPKFFKQGIRGVKRLPPVAALHHWDDEGECWCAARSVNHRGNPHGASLSVQLGHVITPQHVVIEHILPGASTDPDARPKNIEVYAYIPDSRIRGRVQDFATTHFPDDRDDWNFHEPQYGSAFVKIGQFIYQDAELHDGVHVHRLSSELEALGVATDQVIIRAISNYGAHSHTCFYRVRLFGQRA